MNKLNLIIPMAGSGSRFQKAGYPTYKPFIKINGKFMVDYVLDAFPRYVKKYLIINPKLVGVKERAHLENREDVKLLEIIGHKEGPSYSIHLVKDKLPLDESFFVAYVDIYWTWNFSEVEKLIHYDGIAFCRRKFHPHLIHDNFSGFYLPEEGTNFVKKISVKGPFTDNWMEEPLDTAVYYFKSGRDMTTAIARHLIENKRTAGEFFVPLVFEDLLAAGKKVILHDVDFFIHWGIPEQLENFLHWKNHFKINQEERTKEYQFWEKYHHLLLKEN